MTRHLIATFCTLWLRDMWQLGLLSIPLVRSVLYVAHLAPAQLDDDVVNPPLQAFALCILGASALLAMYGIMRGQMIVERAGLHVLGPTSVIYGIAASATNTSRGTVTLIAYCVIGACCMAEARKLTKALRIVNRRLWDAKLRSEADTRKTL